MTAVAHGFEHRVIMHVDMDAFFVGVELLTRPELVGRQVVVAGSGTRSVVLSASYEARALGVHSAMPTARARQLAPKAIYIEPTHGAYRHYSERVMRILREVTDLVEQVSVDEAFLDVTGAIRRMGSPATIARRLRSEITQATGLVASVGIAGNKFLAKMASTGSKPDGLWLVPDHRVHEFLDPLPVRKLWGVGEKTAHNLHDAGFDTVGAVRQASMGFLQRRLGRASGAHIYNLARGIDDRPVVTERTEKSMGSEHTFSYDTDDVQEIKTVLLQLSHDVARRLRASGRRAYGIAIKVRDESFRTVSRARTLDQGAMTGREVYDAAVRLFDDLGPLASRVRLVGVRAERLDEHDAGRQLSLWDSVSDDQLVTEGEWDHAESAMDQIRERFGPTGLLPARLLHGSVAPRYDKNGPRQEGITKGSDGSTDVPREHR
ncbi:MULTISPECIES: DNA polymerase IV [Micrococcales]|uniref:DNA polymerase IV n=1 Tax=Micrococcales TaxID=85006 RepID=UPI0009EB9028|nr:MULTISPECIES: DNA polymerase IV [Micrococcales]